MNPQPGVNDPTAFVITMIVFTLIVGLIMYFQKK